MAVSNRSPRLYHGGAPGFDIGDLITPHGTKHFDGCPTCAALADENHLPDRVFATPIRIYAKHYASKWGRGSLYLVEPTGKVERSEADSLETYHAPAWCVVWVCERGVELTMSERRHLYRLWGESDRSAGFGQDGRSQLEDLRLRRLLGIR